MYLSSVRLPVLRSLISVGYLTCLSYDDTAHSLFATLLLCHILHPFLDVYASQFFGGAREVSADLVPTAVRTLIKYPNTGTHEPIIVPLLDKIHNTATTTTRR